jgi:hypothetical protein
LFFERVTIKYPSAGFSIHAAAPFQREGGGFTTETSSLEWLPDKRSIS